MWSHCDFILQWKFRSFSDRIANVRSVGHEWRTRVNEWKMEFYYIKFI